MDIVGALIPSLEAVHALYFKFSFNDESKFGLLQIAAINVQDLTAFAIYRSTTDYASLKKVILDFDIGGKEFQ